MNKLTVLGMTDFEFATLLKLTDFMPQGVFPSGE